MTRKTNKVSKAARILNALSAHTYEPLRVECEIKTNYATGEQFEQIIVYAGRGWASEKRIILADLYDNNTTVENLSTEETFYGGAV